LTSTPLTPIVATPAAIDDFLRFFAASRRVPAVLWHRKRGKRTGQTSFEVLTIWRMRRASAAGSAAATMAETTDTPSAPASMTEAALSADMPPIATIG